MRILSSFALPVALLMALPLRICAQAESNTQAGASTAPVPDPASTSATAPASPFSLRPSGYADLQFAYYDHGPNQNRAGGAQRDSRLTFDAVRFVLELKGSMPWGIGFEAELEIEHAGTGSALDLEHEEFGEFEQSVNNGGEVLLEELYVSKSFGDAYSVKLGRFYVAVGVLSRYETPTQYLGTTRPEAETTVIPAVWDEMGLQLQASYPWLRLTAQVVNGLDSSGFSSQRWVASGHQGRFPEIRATDFAFVGRVDFLLPQGTELGVSAYYGGTTRNRPKPDLVLECADADPDEVAPCGYLNAPLLVADVHVLIRVGRFRANALALIGHLENAAAISSRNERLSNALGVLRTPVADEALALWAEAGYDVAPWLGLAQEHRLEPFVRVDYYDTMFGTRDGLFDNPRFERTVLTAGVSYALAQAFVLKLDVARRHFGTSSLRPETTARLATAFVY